MVCTRKPCVTTNSVESSLGWKYRYNMNPGNGSGLAGEKRGQEAAWEMKATAGFTASLFSMFLFTLYSETHTQKKKNSGPSSRSVTCEFTGSDAHHLLPCCKQREQVVGISQLRPMANFFFFFKSRPSVDVLTWLHYLSFSFLSSDFPHDVAL